MRAGRHRQCHRQRGPPLAQESRVDAHVIHRQSLERDPIDGESGGAARRPRQIAQRNRCRHATNAGAHRAETGALQRARQPEGIHPAGEGPGRAHRSEQRIGASGITRQITAPPAERIQRHRDHQRIRILGRQPEATVTRQRSTRRIETQRIDPELATAKAPDDTRSIEMQPAHIGPRERRADRSVERRPANRRGRRHPCAATGRSGEANHHRTGPAGPCGAT